MVWGSVPSFLYTMSLLSTRIRSAKQAYSIITNNLPTGLIVWATDPTEAKDIVGQYMFNEFRIEPNATAQGINIQTLKLSNSLHHD